MRGGCTQHSRAGRELRKKAKLGVGGRCREKAPPRDLRTGTRKRRRKWTAKPLLNAPSLGEETAEPGKTRPLTGQTGLGLGREHQPLRQRALPGRERGGLGLGLGRAGGRGLRRALSPQFRRMGWASGRAEGRDGLVSSSTAGGLRALKRGGCCCNQ